MEEGEEVLVLFGGVHSSERQECGLEEGRVQVVEVRGLCGLCEGKYCRRKRHAAATRKLLPRVLVGEGRWACEGYEGAGWQLRATSVCGFEVGGKRGEGGDAAVCAGRGLREEKKEEGGRQVG